MSDCEVNGNHLVAEPVQRVKEIARVGEQNEFPD
jgi:hypothetical protein